MLGSGVLLERFRASISIYARLFDNPDLRRVELAYAGFNLAEWSTWIAVLVFAYREGGTVRVGVVALALLAPAAVVALFGSGLGDRYRRDRFLTVGYGLQAVTMLATGMLMLWRARAPWVYALAAAATAAIALTRPAQSALLPWLTSDLSELTAANGASSTIENLSVLAGPVLTAVLLAVAAPGWVWAAMGALMALATVLASRIAVVTADSDSASHTAPGGSLVTELMEGVRIAVRLSKPRLIVGLLALFYILFGMLDVFVVVLALNVLHLGQSAVGYLMAAIGLGGLLGAGVSTMLIGRQRLSIPFQLGLGLPGLSLAVIGGVPVLAVTVAMLAGVGLGRNLIDVCGRTLLQRVVPDRVLARLFGFLETLYNALLGLGAVLAPLLLVRLGTRATLALVGITLVVLVLLPWRQLRELDTVAVPAEARLSALRRIPMFAPLPPYTLERLANALHELTVKAGTVVVREGESDRDLFVIAAGRAQVVVKDEPITHLGRFETFGEIAALRGGARTATVSAVTDLDLYRLPYRTFVEAVSRHAVTEQTLTALIGERLARA